MSKIIRIFAFIFILIMVIAGTTGCSEPPPADEGEVHAAAKELLPLAVEANRIFFWEGLPHVEPDEDDSVDIGDAEYLELTEEYMYLSESDLMEKAEKVYTKKYCEDIRKVAFEGVAVTKEDALYARYIVELGVMKINRRLSEEGLAERIPNIDSIKTVEIKHDSAVLSVEFTCEGKVEIQNVTLKLEDDGWRIDSPTY
ncbi:MAG: hypothetical protein E7578_03505 [Ruminococcaceae bacterium]|nr:hypothetical protein [Oscillospiraceae bacterium]